MNPQELQVLRRKIINDVIDIEGGYVNNPKDSGGATKLGITHATARKHGIMDVRQLTKEQAYQIYERDYWEAVAGDELANRSPALAFELFDTAVNMGDGRAAEFLQVALNLLNREQQLYNDIVVDNAIGPKTLAALDSFLAHRGKPGIRILLKLLDILQGQVYTHLATSRPKDEQFITGWLDKRIGNAYQDDDIVTPSLKKPKQDESMNNSRYSDTDQNVYNEPPAGYVVDEHGQRIPYWEQQVKDYSHQYDSDFSTWLRTQANEARKAANSKPGWKSKIMLTALNMVASALAIGLAKYDFDVSAETLLNLALLIMFGGGSVIAIFRKYFTTKFLS